MLLLLSCKDGRPQMNGSVHEKDEHVHAAVTKERVAPAVTATVAATPYWPGTCRFISRPADCC